MIAEAIYSVLGRQASDSEIQAVQAVAWLETQYGAGWKPGEGAGSWNMGAITDPKCGPLSFKHRDSKNVGGKIVWYETCFKGYENPLAGFKDLVRTMYVARPKVLLAATEANLPAVSRELRLSSYYLGIANTIEEQIRDHLSRMASALRTITGRLNEKIAFVLPEEPGRGGKMAGGMLALALLGLGAVAFFKRK